MPAAVPFIGVAPSIKPWRISAGVRLGTSWSIKAATAAALGVADEVPKKLGRSCDRLVPVAGSPGNGGLAVSMIWPGEKNEVLPPSGAVIVGFSTTVAPVLSGAPLTLKTWSAGPNELNGSFASGFWPRYGAGAHQGVAPTPMVCRVALWPNDVGIIGPAGTAVFWADDHVHVFVDIRRTRRGPGWPRIRPGSRRSSCRHRGS